MKRSEASFWKDQNGYMATWKWWLTCSWTDLICLKQAACRKVLGRSFFRKL
jgi:hypothetical protein